MNLDYLNNMEEIPNRYNVDLVDGEKVIFTAQLDTFGTDKDRALSSTLNPYFTLTNKRIIIDNHAGIWTIVIDHDIASCTKVSGGKWFFKYVYFSIMLKEEMLYDNGNQKLNGFHLYFNHEDTIKFERIINHLIF